MLRTHVDAREARARDAAWGMIATERFAGEMGLYPSDLDRMGMRLRRVARLASQA